MCTWMCKGICMLRVVLRLMCAERPLQVGPGDKDLLLHEDFESVVGPEFYEHFDKAEGPLLMVAPY